MQIIGYFWQDDEYCTCEKCGIRRIRNMFVGADGEIPGRPVPMHDNELVWDDRIRCDNCGHRLVERARRPGGGRRRARSSGQQQPDRARSENPPGGRRRRRSDDRAGVRGPRADAGADRSGPGDGRTHRGRQRHRGRKPDRARGANRIPGANRRADDDRPRSEDRGRNRDKRAGNHGGDRKHGGQRPKTAEPDAGEACATRRRPGGERATAARGHADTGKRGHAARYRRPRKVTIAAAGVGRKRRGAADRERGTESRLAGKPRSRRQRKGREGSRTTAAPRSARLPATPRTTAQPAPESYPGQATGPISNESVCGKSAGAPITEQGRGGRHPLHPKFNRLRETAPEGL